MSRIVHVGNKLDRGGVVVTARARNGAIGTKNVLITQLACHVGDTVHGRIQGIVFTFDERACIKPGRFSDVP